MKRKERFAVNENADNDGLILYKKTARIFIGEVVSDKRQKTVAVLVRKRSKHSLLGKIVEFSKKYHVHDEYEEYSVGDVVEISETKPFSKSKSWTVSRLIQKVVATSVFNV
jgi:small subunit ribosomal protein S17